MKIDGDDKLRWLKEYEEKINSLMDEFSVKLGTRMIYTMILVQDEPPADLNDTNIFSITNTDCADGAMRLLSLGLSLMEAGNMEEYMVGPKMTQ